MHQESLFHKTTSARADGMPSGRRPLPGWAMGALILLAIAFIVAGAYNGGLQDVLVKAIRICTECIGLS